MERRGYGLRRRAYPEPTVAPTPEPTVAPTPAPTAEPDTGPDYAQERTEAVSLGDIADTEPTNVESTVDDDDPIDYFKFSLSADREVGLRIRRLDFNADLYIEDNSGTVIHSSENAGSAKEVLGIELGATGTDEFYYVRVEGKEAGENDYTFRYLTEEIATPEPTPEPVPEPISRRGVQLHRRRWALGVRDQVG